MLDSHESPLPEEENTDTSGELYFFYLSALTASQEGEDLDSVRAVASLMLEQLAESPVQLSGDIHDVLKHILDTEKDMSLQDAQEAMHEIASLIAERDSFQGSKENWLKED